MSELHRILGSVAPESVRPDGLDRVDREMWALLRDVVGWRTGPALVGVALLADVYLPWVERRLVLRARREGISWTGIGRLLGRSRQAVQERHHRVVDAGDLLPPALPRSYVDIDRRDRAEVLADLRRMREADADDVVAW